MNNKNTSLFLVTVLVAGIIGMSPLSVYAQGAGGITVAGNGGGGGGDNNICQNFNIIQSTNILDVDNTNTQTNTPAAAAAANANEPFQQQDKNSNLDTTVNGQQVTPEKILNSLFGSNNGNGEPPLRNFGERDVCINVNNNSGHDILTFGFGDVDP